MSLTKLQSFIQHLSNGQSLSVDEMREAMMIIMQGQESDVQISGFLIALNAKGPSIDEIYGAAKVLRELATKVAVSGPLLDTCGTGGDGKKTFNISTLTAIVSAAAGARIAKHGNRSVSSQSGSADVLEAAGMNINLTPQNLAKCIDTVGVAFLFAPLHHGAMKHVVSIRKDLGIRTIFNILGPLVNPAAASHQILGIYQRELLTTIAGVLAKLNSQHALVVHAEDGMDEISLCSPTYIAELHQGKIKEYVITPEEFGFVRAKSTDIQATSPQDSLSIIHSVLDNQKGPAHDIVCLNSGAALYAADYVTDISSGIVLAKNAIESGTAREKFEDLIAFTKTHG